MKRNFGFKPYEGDGKCGFISYKSEDEKLVAPYAKALYDMGVMLWYDYGIPAGEDWFEVISQEIVESSFMILFVTEKIFHSSVIQTEIQTAEMWDIPVVPVFLEKINRKHIPKKQASLLAKLYLKQGVNEAWRLSIGETADSIYELISPMLDSDTAERIEQRGRLREHQASLARDLPDDQMVQNALSEVRAEETNSDAAPELSEEEKLPFFFPEDRDEEESEQVPFSLSEEAMRELSQEEEKLPFLFPEDRDEGGNVPLSVSFFETDSEFPYYNPSSNRNKSKQIFIDESKSRLRVKRAPVRPVSKPEEKKRSSEKIFTDEKNTFLSQRKTTYIPPAYQPPVAIKKNSSAKQDKNEKNTPIFHDRDRENKKATPSDYKGDSEKDLATSFWVYMIAIVIIIIILSFYLNS